MKSCRENPNVGFRDCDSWVFANFLSSSKLSSVLSYEFHQSRSNFSFLSCNWLAPTGIYPMSKLEGDSPLIWAFDVTCNVVSLSASETLSIRKTFTKILLLIDYHYRPGLGLEMYRWKPIAFRRKEGSYLKLFVAVCLHSTMNIREEAVKIASLLFESLVQTCNDFFRRQFAIFKKHCQRKLWFLGSARDSLS